MTAAPGQMELLAQLRQSLGLLQVAFDAASEAMVIFDPEGVVRWGNQAAADLWTDGLAILLVGRHQEQLLQPIANRSGQPLERSSAEHPLQQWQLGDGGGVFELRGQQLRLEWRLIPEPGSGYRLLLARDLEPQEQALQLQRRFLNQLAHELQTPLAIVGGSLNRVQAKATELGQASLQWLQQAREETSRLGRLISSLMALTDLEMGRRVLVLQPHPVVAWLEQWSVRQPLPEAATLKFSWDPAAAEAQAVFDAQAVDEVLAQLLDNSQRYCGEAAVRIELHLEITEGHWVLHWRDHGLGISAKPREQVFDRFVRLEEHRRSDQVDGAGLGLAVAAELMAAMGGQLSLGPAVDGAGVEFLLRWPRRSN